MINNDSFYRTGTFDPVCRNIAWLCLRVFLRKTLNKQIQRALTGFAAGVMVAASIWSLLLPAIEQSKSMGKLSFIPAVVGFWIGIFFCLFLDHVTPHLHLNSKRI